MAGSSPRTILLIDDDAAMHDLTRAHLEKSGYALLSAYDAATGLQMILKQRPDLVLLDFMMPEMDGESAFNELTGNPAYRAVQDTPVIMLTARGGDEQMKTTLLERGVSAYLQKPFGLRELTNVIENVFIIHDIRLRNQQLREEVEITRDHLELVMRTAPIGIFSTDENGGLQHVNHVLARLLDFDSPNELRHGRVADDPRLRDTFLRTAVARVLTGKKPWKIRYFHHRKHSERRRVLNIHCVPVRKSTDELEGVVGIVEDVTETHKRDEQLQMLSTIGLALQSLVDLDDLLHLILTSTTAGPALGFTRAMIFLADSSGQHLVGKMGVGPFDAKEAEEIWKTFEREHLSLEDFLEKYGKRRPASPSRLDLIVREQILPLGIQESDFVRQILRKHTYRGLPGRNDHPSCRKVFRALQLDDFVAVPLIAKDRLKGVVLADNRFSSQPIEADLISLLELFASQAAQAIEKADAYRRLELEKRKLEHAYEQLQATHDRLVHAERLAAIGNMAAHVAHEIRNPLVTIGGFARSLNRQLQEHESARQITNVIMEEVIRLEKILANVLDFSKLPKPSLQLADLNHLIEEVCRVLRDEARERQVEVRRNLAPGLPKMWIDPIQINQLLVNLFRNGIQAMKGGGVLELRTLLWSKRFARITVRDTGSGIPPDIIEDIFKPFFTTKTYGTGLGLAICRQIVNDHGGEISVQSAPGSGTIFTIDLPLEKRSAAEKFDAGFDAEPPALTFPETLP
ncbi:response regulator [candidate division KSB1 bacterium]|nr:ATP-binding protein [bacterium]NUM66393.1 response regulator [candidate division KSB1 bacterium]